MIVFVIEVVVVLLLVYVLLAKRSPLDIIPGPKPYPIVGNVLQLDLPKLFTQLADFAKQYGGIYKIKLFSQPVVVVSDLDFIHNVLIKQSAEFAGRPRSLRIKIMSDDFNEISLTDPGPEHSGRRKAVQKYVKQYGAGIQKIENITQTATDDLIQRFANQHGNPIDPHDFLCKCVTDVITILLVGDVVSQEQINEIWELLDKVNEAIGPGVGILLDWFPCLRFAGMKTYKTLTQFNAKRYAIVTDWMKQKPADGFISFIQAMSEEEKRNFLDTEGSQVGTSWVFFVAGMMTTTVTLNCLTNVLCQYPDVQGKLRKEVMDVIGPARHPTLKDQGSMPYLRATILEIGRFTSVAPFAVPHKSMQTCKLDKYTIPKDTEVWVNLWAMHHDEKVWDEPFAFKPERFLDADGQLVPADHPNRKNVMAFGAGHRVCVGEVFAVSRMFLITARILQNFTILPETTLEKQPSCDPRDMKMGFIVSPKPFKVRLIPVLD